ncbi:response regulator [Geomonas paludis]|uniref:Response regulator n=1 Tax=Geomonas paludis TaxID=2740185 RepID=A0A6V8MWR7_9BACT|nr:response regulator [Geomonas paludis]UPU34890.1 response regulator [Geomonas paludis]GFO64656.1 two-component system response regulator [Geomonas paludis]
MKIPLGQLLVQSGIITVKTLDRALARQQSCGLRLGGVLLEMGVITGEELLEALGQQSGLETVKRIPLDQFSPELLALVPGELALARQLFPLRQQDGTLFVAVGDPLDAETLGRLERCSSRRVVQLLAAPEEIANAVKQYYRQAQALAEMKILLVDDPAAMNCDVEGALKKEGYQVFIARDGVEGLKIAFSQKPDLILCDASSPRMDGYALMRAIKANPASAGTPMILLTSKASPEEEHRALKAGFHDFIAKPVMTIRVVSRVKRAFEIMDKYRETQAAPPA